MIYSICKCDTRLSVRYLMREEKERFGEGLQADIGISSKAFVSKQSVKFKCQIWFEITNKFAKKYLDASSHA